VLDGLPPKLKRALFWIIAPFSCYIKLARRIEGTLERGGVSAQQGS
jgi:hypothetical protein